MVSCSFLVHFCFEEVHLSCLLTALLQLLVCMRPFFWYLWLCLRAVFGLLMLLWVESDTTVDRVKYKPEESTCGYILLGIIELLTLNWQSYMLTETEQRRVFHKSFPYNEDCPNMQFPNVNLENF